MGGGQCVRVCVGGGGLRGEGGSGRGAARGRRTGGEGPTGSLARIAGLGVAWSMVK